MSTGGARLLIGRCGIHWKVLDYLLAYILTCKNELIYKSTGFLHANFGAFLKAIIICTIYVCKNANLIQKW